MRRRRGFGAALWRVLAIGVVDEAYLLVGHDAARAKVERRRRAGTRRTPSLSWMHEVDVFGRHERCVKRH
jgi:hypothetical protein